MMVSMCRVSFLSLLALVSFIHGGSAARRFLLYDCNPGEGFNLRRDVYIRMANLVKYLNSKEDWTLVLPPWGGIGYHWQATGLEESMIPWSKFFDVQSLSKHVSVMEYDDYITEQGEAIDEVWYLQSYAEGVDYDNYKYQVHERPCIDQPVYRTDSYGRIRGWFWGYGETYGVKFKCVSAQGSARTIAPALLGGNTTATSVMLDRAEKLSHDIFAGKDFWDARRSMVFSAQMRTAAKNFRELFLNANVTDETIITEDWRDNRREDDSAFGDPYIAAHLRRKDFLVSRAKEVPSLEKAASILNDLAARYEVDTVFIASDGTEEEMKQLAGLIRNMVRYNPLPVEIIHFKRGGIAIIDQIICSHARYFIGSYESTFTFRITEERQIMGFAENTTYNRFCGDAEETCQQLIRYKMVWEDDRELWT